MKTRQYLMKSFGFLFLFCMMSLEVSAQFGFGTFPATSTMVDTPRLNMFNQNPASMGGNTPTPTTITTNPLPNFQQRIDELKKQGVSQQDIETYISDLQNGKNPSLPKPSVNVPPKTTTSVPPTNTTTPVTKTEPEENPQELMTFEEFLKKNGGISKKGNQIEIEKKKTDKFDISRADSIMNLVWNDDSTRWDTTWYVKTTVPKEKKVEHFIFGHEFFRNKNLGTMPDTFSLAPPDDYVIQAGDEFGISAWNGTSMTSDNLLVESDGSVSRQYVGRKFVAGMTYKDARNLLENAYRNILPSGAMLRIRLSKSVSKISVNIVGEVKNPGTFIMSNYATLLNALMAAGGITDLATVRNIYIKRDGKPEEVFDLYNLLIDGRVKPIYLKNNDYIVVPIQGDIVAVTGFVKRPRKYEMKEGEDVATLLRYAGGVGSYARTNNIKINRVYDGQQQLVDVNMNTARGQRLHDGDIVTVEGAESELLNIVEAKGAVVYPNNYAYRQGMRVKDLIDLSGGLQRAAALDKAYIVRIPKLNEVTYIPIELTNISKNAADANNILLQPLDQLIVLNASLANINKTIDIDGAVYSPGTHKIAPKMTLKDVLYLANGLKPDADYDHIELGYSRGGVRDPNFKLSVKAGDDLPYTDTRTRRVAVRADWKNDPTLDTIFVEKYRYVQVYSRYEDYKGKELKVEGAVKKARTIPLSPTLTLKDVLFLVGGPSLDADYNHVELSYYKYSTGEKDPNYKLTQEKGELFSTEVGSRRFAISTDWKNDPTLDTIFVGKYRYLKVYSRYDDYIGKIFTISGSVKKPIQLQLTPTLTLRDALFFCEGPVLDADLEHIELSFYQNIDASNADSLNTAGNNKLLRHVAIGTNWKDDASLDTILLKNYRYLRVYPRSKYRWQREVSITGSVENAKKLVQVKGMTLREALYLCGGLKRNEEDYYIVDLYGHFRQQDVGNLNLKPSDRNIQRIIIDKDWWKDPKTDTLLITPYDEIIVRSQNEFYYDGMAEVKGLVNNPGEFRVQPKMSLKDVLYRAGGVPMETDFTNIEISRVLKIENTNGDIAVTPVKIKRYTISQDWRNDKKIDSIFIYAFDQIFVRPNYEFQLQKNVFIEGQVKTPGEYSKVSPTERLSSLVKRANGFTPEAFPSGAKLTRVGLSLSDTLVIQLDKAVHRPRSRYDLILKEGDRLIVPTIDPTVRINGNVLVPNTFVAYDKTHKSFKYYVHLAGGFAKRTQHNECIVKYANGMTKGTKRVLLFINVYPEVTAGSTLIIPQKPQKGLDDQLGKQQLGATIKELTADVASILSLVALMRAITK